MLALSASGESKVGGKVQWYPISREKRARYGAPGLGQGIGIPMFVFNCATQLPIEWRPIRDR